MRIPWTTAQGSRPSRIVLSGATESQSDDTILVRDGAPTASIHADVSTLAYRLVIWDILKTWTSALNSLVHTTLLNDNPMVIHGVAKDVDVAIGNTTTDENFADFTLYTLSVYNMLKVTKKYIMSETTIAILASKPLQVCKVSHFPFVF